MKRLLLVSVLLFGITGLGQAERSPLNAAGWAASPCRPTLAEQAACIRKGGRIDPATCTCVIQGAP
jgi:hypothetical protein